MEKSHQLVVATGILLCGLIGSASAANWQGGDGDWTDPTQWDLGTEANDYPGSPTYPSEFAKLDANGPGVVTVKEGDNIAQGSNIFMGSSGATISHTGGTLSVNLRIDNRTEYNLTGGTLTDDGSSEYWINEGGVFHVSDNGVWQRGATTTSIDYKGAGTIHVTGGTVTLGRVNMNDAGSGARVFKVTGTEATNVETDTLYLLPPDASSTATAEFVFDVNGIDPINVTATGGGAKLLIDDLAGHQGDLNVDMTSYGSTSGTEGFVLLDYYLPNRRQGEFGDVMITGMNGMLSLGTDKDSLTANQYFLSYDDSDVGDGSSIVLYANIGSIPEPSSLMLLGLGIGLLLPRARH